MDKEGIKLIQQLMAERQCVKDALGMLDKLKCFEQEFTLFLNKTDKIESLLKELT